MQYVVCDVGVTGTYERTSLERIRRVWRNIMRALKNAEAPPEIIVLLSGGIDSAACLDLYLNIGRPVCGLFVDYGQLAAGQEERAARAITDHYSVELKTVHWKGLSTKSSGLIQGRNGFLVFAALMERPRTVSGIAIGIHAGTEYADCSVSFLRVADNLVKHCTDQSVEVLAPLVEWGKGDIFKYCESNNIPLHLTYSCEQGTEPPCGGCLSCKDKELQHAGS